MKIEDIDSNFKSAEFSGKLYTFLDIRNEAFEIGGFPWYRKNGQFCRLPEEALSNENINNGARQLAWHTSGGTVRFKTNSPSIVIKLDTKFKSNMSHMPRSGSSGVDVYLGTGKKKKFRSSVIPTINYVTEKSIPLSENGETSEVTINLPLYDGINSFTIGIEPGSAIMPPTPYTICKPILFYGSSITQGGCASRPGNAYIHHLGRWVDAEVISMGFSGCGRGETAVAEIIASLDLAAFIMDYDHNASTPEYLQKTHEAFFKTIRAKQPELPIILVSKPDTDLVSEEDVRKRLDTIKTTYNNAIMANDSKVFLVDGRTLFGKSHRDTCTVDGVHPNDVGFLRMAEHIYPTLAKALGINE